jgi:SAM-dependent methyltransferase
VPIRTVSDLLVHEEELDLATCGRSLVAREVSLFREQGANEPTPTPYFVLDELFRHFSFDEQSHLLDVGCGTGRVLAYFLQQGFQGKATGVELDPELADITRSWVGGLGKRSSVNVVQGDVLSLDLERYTDFYLFNPFSATVLQQFIFAVEQQVKHPCTVVHMSDNGDSWWYAGRDGWTEVASGAISTFRNDRGFAVKFYETPQHYTVWHHAER